MNKMKKVIILFVTTILVILSTSNAFAKQLDPFLGPYMTDEGSYDKKDVFGWNEKPFAFIQFDVDNLNANLPLFVTWKWKFMGKGHPFWEFEKVTDFSDDSLNIWNSVDNWDSYKKVGEWSVRTTWWNPSVCSGKGGWGNDKINFTVTPEPYSSILLVFGAGCLGTIIGLKRKKIAKANP